MDFISGRKRPSFGWIEALTLCVFSAVVATGIAVHEAWADEAQAWLLARDLGWWKLMLHGVRYEGTPGLWHTLLWILNRLQFSFQGMHWIAGGIAVCGVFVFLRWSPFPLLLRILLPFTFFLAYQNAVIARSYVLFPLLVFTVAALLSVPRLQPIALAVAAGLLANVSLHGFVEATGLAIGFLLARRKAVQVQDGGNRTRTTAIAVGVFATFWIIAIATAFPPSDISARPGARIQKLLHGHKATKTISSGLEEFEVKDSDSANELTPIPTPDQKKTRWESKQLLLIKQLSVITYPLSESHLLGLVLFALLLLRAVPKRNSGTTREISQRQLWTGLLPYLLLVVFFSRMYLKPWHTGTIFASFIVAVWLTWPPEKPVTHFALWRERLLVLALCVMCIEQIGWTAHALKQDVQGAYSGDEAAADFLKQNAQGKKVAGYYFFSIGPVAYLGHPLYLNQPDREYWSWSSKVRVNAEAPAALEQHPDFIVVSTSSNWNPQGIIHGWHYISGKPAQESLTDDEGDDYQIVNYFEAHGYHKTHVFCGHPGMRSGSFAELCQVILEPRS